MLVIPFATISTPQILAAAAEQLQQDLPDWERKVWRFIQLWNDNRADAIAVFTSGSTGQPREILHKKKHIRESALMTGKVLKLTTNMNALLCLPADKISGMMMIVRAMELKMNLHCVRPAAHPLNELTAEHNLHFAAFTPAQVHSIIASTSARTTFSAIGKVLLGGENTPRETVTAIAHLPNEVYVTFGMTETISHIALKRINGTTPDQHYTVPDGIKISVDENERLIVTAPQLGVVQLRTTDIVSLVSQTQFDWIGRADNVINTGGVKVFPEQIEKLLLSDLNMPFFVTGIRDEKYGERVALVIETAQAEDADKEKITLAVSKLPKLQRPKTMMLCRQFVKTANGKLQRKESVQQSYYVTSFI